MTSKVVSEPKSEIRPYAASDRDLVEVFRKQTKAEGNDSLSLTKFNPDSLNGRLLLFFYDNKLVSLSAAEASHYTGDPDIACRICRYHTLKEYRKLFLFCGFKMLILHTAWARQQGFSVAYWTHDMKNKALNSLYQKTRRYTLGADNSWFENPAFKSFNLNKDYLFRVSEKSDMLQYIYFSVFKPEFVWQPKAGVVRWNDGQKEVPTPAR